MRNGKKHTVAVSVGGMMGGLLGAAAIEKAIGLSRKLPEPLHMPELKGNPAEYVVSKVEKLSGGPLPPESHARAVKASPWIYGLAWAGALAGFARPLRMYKPLNAALAGAALGTLVWAADYLGWLPAAGLTKPITRQQPSRLASSLVGHVLFGVVAAIPIFAVEHLFKRRRVFGLV
jgi:hypothetical protein